MGCCNGLFPCYFPYYYPFVLTVALGPYNHPWPFYFESFFLVMRCCNGFCPYDFPYYYPFVLSVALGPHNHRRPFISGLFSCHGLVLCF